ncbi:MAG: sulfite exporter TauE/SafE family protein [Phycisphaerales bacterium]|nr:sulfite exporter TauE/SafE family protein [Phycisphaerales bacterium]
MTIGTSVLLMVIGAVAGALSGLVGIGGGVVVVPALVYLLAVSQKQAQGTTLAMMLPPIGVLAVIAYARAGNVNWVWAGLLVLGFLAGSYLGAGWALGQSEAALKRVFGVVTVLIGIWSIYKSFQ